MRDADAIRRDALAALERWVDEHPVLAEDGAPMVRMDGTPFTYDVLDAVRTVEKLRAELGAAAPVPGLMLLDAPPELAPHVSDVLLGGAGRIAVERARQKLDEAIGGEGYDAEHDAEEGENLAVAAAQYALPSTLRTIVRGGAPLLWPWQLEYWKPTPKDRIRELEKAGALVAAAIDALLAEGKVRDAADPD